MKDRELKKSILEELKRTQGVDAAAIGVAVHNGAVTIYGYVSAYPERVEAEAAVRRVPGVTAVANEIDVNLPGNAIVDDAELARRAACLLDWDHITGGQGIRAIVKGGRITLEGGAAMPLPAERAEQLVSGLRGVTGVVNHIRVTAHLAAED